MFTVATESELEKVVAMLVTASVPDDRDNENAWTRRFVTEMEKLAAPLLKQSGKDAHEQKGV
jgi:hypothetical protein